MQPSRDGTHILWDENTFWSDNDLGAGSQVHRMTIDGNIFETIPTPGLHQPFTELDDNVLVWADTTFVYDQIVFKLPGLDPLVLWRCVDFLVDIIPEGESAVDNDKYSNCGANSIHWNRERNTLLVSFYTSSSIVELDAGTG